VCVEYFSFLGASNLLFKNLVSEGGHWCLMPVVLVTWEAGIGRIMVQGQPGQKSVWDIISMGKIAGCGDTSLLAQQQLEVV
jgi:hypothetical protein